MAASLALGYVDWSSKRVGQLDAGPLYRPIAASATAPATMARPPQRSLIVPSALMGERLDRAIAALAPDVSRGEARRLIAAGVIFLGGRRTGISSRAVRSGEAITWDAPAQQRATEAGGELHGLPRVVVERDELWIVDKPAGMPVEPTRAGSAGTLSEWLRRARGTPFVTHRLDTPTSGLVVVARDAATQARLNQLFATHGIGRRYIAVVSPPPPWETVTLDEKLDGRPAVTHARVLCRSPVAAALEVELQTGRTRQIRRHLATAGFPVVGETASGARTHARLLLHAFELRLPWAGREGPLTATAPLPPDFTSATTTLALAIPSDLLPP